MGMAASQARYLALVARKSNCEYEGQQINQARTALANQSANLFNQMLGLQVPVPPSTQDFTKVQYSFTDGANASTIDSWQQLATPEENFNYVVTRHYYTNVYTGSEKKLTDPQVQIKGLVADQDAINDAWKVLSEAQKKLDEVKKYKSQYELAQTNLELAQANASNIDSYKSTVKNITECIEGTDADAGTYTITTNDEVKKYVPFDSLTDQTAANQLLSAMRANGVSLPNNEDLYFTEDGAEFVLEEDLVNLLAVTPETPGTLNEYGHNVSSVTASLQAAQNALTAAQANYQAGDLEAAQGEYDDALANYKALNQPSYVGNCELTYLGELTEDQEAEIRQIVSDMKEQGITSEIIDCYDPASGYSGGIYTFTMNGQKYFTTYNDLVNAYNSGEGINNIDGQHKMPYYNATYVSTKIEKTEKALLETDGAGRFSTVRFESDSITYSLKMETITDDVAYEDAMNQYYYENAKYDKMVQDINAKTSIIQQQDRTLELRLKQLDTEHNALSTEIDAVQKVVKDNVDKSFKTFGG